jgi:5-methyltetrahydropteroyltriglutamate--homocysteine methyltransferase
MPASFHSDVIGSLLRPRYLAEARAALDAGRISVRDFKVTEDRAVDAAIATQEAVGLDQLLGDMEGVTPQEGAAVKFHARDPKDDWDWHPPFIVTGKLRANRMITPEEFIYARARAHKRVKITLPSPLVVYGAWSPTESTAAYKDAYELFADAAEIMKNEVRELARMGCDYVQFDSPDLGTIVDPENRDMRAALGMPTERTLTEGVEIFNSVADVPGVTFGLHLCKGNYESKWIASGGYESTAEAVFQGMTNFDVFLLEYDDERSGSFEPLAKVPDDKQVILGLITSKYADLEKADEVIARINEAARYTGLERLGLSTQCGFSPVSIGGNHITEEDQERKLELVAHIASQVW